MASIPGFSLELNYVVLMVGDKPYCYWSNENVIQRNLQFLNDINPAFFMYQAQSNLKLYNYKKYKQDAALAIRIAFSHGLETLFSLIGAAIQAPFCVQAWMLLCKNSQLYNLIDKINNGVKIPTMLKVDHQNWRTISEVVYKSLVLEDKEKEESIKSSFGNLWGQWGLDFVNKSFTDEYNSIKHGFRIKPGGFAFSIGVQEKPGMPASSDKMQLVGKGEFGSAFSNYEPIGNSSRNIFLKMNHRNWDPEDMAWGLQLIAMSIGNIISCLKILNGIPANKIKYQWPREPHTFREPWKRIQSVGITSMTGLGQPIPIELITRYSDEELIALYNEGKVLHTKPINIEKMD
jgi:hypothetical protein